jgi:hypothetical protein
VDFFKDFTAFGFPAIGFGVEVALCEAGFVAASKFDGTGEASFADAIAAEAAKTRSTRFFHGDRRREAQSEARMPDRRCLDLAVLMRGMFLPQALQRQANRGEAENSGSPRPERRIARGCALRRCRSSLRI